MQVMQNLQTTFRFTPWYMELSKFTVNCAKSTQFADPCPELCKIHAFHAIFSRFYIPSGKIAKIHTICIMFNSCRFHMIHTIGNNPGYSEFSKICLVFINSQ